MENNQAKHQLFTKVTYWVKNINTGLIVFLCLLSYGLLIPWMGYYWDDWVFAYTIKFLGPNEFIPSFIPFRPFLGPIFTVTTSILGTHPLAWQLFNLILRIGSGVAALWAFRKIWPNARLQTLLAALFFVVYPGYNQQWVALTHSNQEIISLICYVLSLGFMVRAIRHKPFHLPSTIIALSLTFVGLYPTEYFFGLEILRPFIIWFAIKDSQTIGKGILKKTIVYWLPYLLLWVSNWIFLYVFHNSAYYDSYGIQAFSPRSLFSPSFLLATIEDFLNAFILTGFTSWAGTFSLFTKPLNQATTWITFFLIVVSFSALILILTKRNNWQFTDSRNSSIAWQAILLGSIGILAGRFPSWAAGLPLKLEFSWDRFMVSMLFGASLLFIGLIEYFIIQNNKKIIFVSIILALSVGWQFTKANTFRREWDNQQVFFWQLAWRAPQLEKGTLIVTHELPFDYVTDQSLTGPLNWIYAPNQDSKELPYMMAYTKSRIGTSLLPSLQPGLDVSSNFRTMRYESNTDKILVIYWESPGCVRVLDPTYANSETIPGAPYMITDAIPLSNTNQIVAEGPEPVLPKTLFGDEPRHTWCYFFQKAELARQLGEWDEVVRLAGQAETNGFSNILPAENLVFIEGYAKNGMYDEAVALTRRTVAQNQEIKPALCELWDRSIEMEAYTSSVSELVTELGCEQ